MKYKTILVIFIVAFISSTLFSLRIPCDAQNTCEKTESSQYSLFSKINNGYIGMIFFSFLILITVSHIKNPRKFKKTIIHSGIIIGSIIAIYFIYLQQFILKSYCKYCIVIDIGILISLVIAIFTWKK